MMELADEYKGEDEEAGASPGPVERLPTEILEYILSLLPPYIDLQVCKKVCHRWRDCALGVESTRKKEFPDALTEGRVQWTHSDSCVQLQAISKRYGHAACVSGGYLYVFGGLTVANTSFNDLWCLNLNSRQWTRLIVTGSYPSPKGLTTFLPFKDTIVLFGGFTDPMRMFTELHFYHVKNNHWITSGLGSGTGAQRFPPAMAGHSATIHGNLMIVFGGCHLHPAHPLQFISNDVYSLDLGCLTWYRPSVGQAKPSPRYLQTQVKLDDHHLLVIGGLYYKVEIWYDVPFRTYSDVWMLYVDPESPDGPWVWKEMTVIDKQYAATTLWCHPGCLVGNKVVFLNKRDGMKDHSMFSQPGTFPRPDGEPQNGRDENVNGRRGDLSKPRVLNNAESHNPPGNSEDSCQPNYSDTGMPSIRPNARKNRERQLEALRKLEERLQTLRSVPSTESSSSNSRLPQFPKSHGEPMTLHILDVGRAISDGIVTWLPFHGFRDFHSSAPGATVMYTLSLGCNELVMFGGLLKQEGLTRDEVTNTLHFLEMPPKVP